MGTYTSVIKERFLRAISDADDAPMAMEGLTRNNDPDIRALGMMAEAVRESLQKADAAPLRDAMNAFDRLPQTSFWSSLMDEAARTVLAKALAINDYAPSKAGMVEHGVAMAARAVSYGFPASDETIALVRKARDQDKSVRMLADAVLRRNDAQKPQESGDRAFKGKKNSKPAGRKGQRAAG